MAKESALGARKRRKSNRPRGTGTPLPPASRDRAADFLIVGWVQTFLVCALCQAGTTIALWLSNRNPGSLALEAAWRLLLWASFVSGVVLLLLTAAVVRFGRRQAAPGLTVASFILGAVPVVGTIIWWVR